MSEPVRHWADPAHPFTLRTACGERPAPNTKPAYWSIEATCPECLDVIEKRVQTW